jgi:radical SAM protein with 4Fe4S-binding SPASM domain
MVSSLKTSSLMGFPLCVTARIQDRLMPSNDDISDAVKLYFLDQKFVKVKCCSSCMLYSKCAGTFREHVHQHGVKMFRPFGANKREGRIRQELINHGVKCSEILESNRLGEVYVMLSLSCRLRCRVCPWWGDSGVCRTPERIRKYTGELTDMKILRRFIDEIAEFKPSIINLSGGEPLETGGWYDFAKYAKSKGFGVYLTTSGMDIEENLDRICEVIDQVDVSISGPKDIINQLREGPEGHFDRIISGLRKLSERKKVLGRPRIQLSCVVSDLNYTRLDGFADYLKSEGIDIDMHYFPSVIFMSRELVKKQKEALKKEFGADGVSWEGYTYDPRGIDTKRLLQELERLKSKHRDVKFGPMSSREDIDRYFHDDSFLPERFSHHCLAPWLQATLMPNGDIWVCHDLPVGNIRDKSFREIWNGPKIKKLRKRIIEKGLFPGCRGCYYVYYTKEHDKGKFR